MNLKNAADFDLFKPSAEKDIQSNVLNIDGNNLKHYKNHRFKLYSGDKFNQMAESIQLHGIIQPLIIRPISENDFDYEILSGHNRFECGKAVGLTRFPCIVRENLSDDEARFYVIRTNVDQRSLADLSHSERAVILLEDYEVNKKQGKRNDLISDIDNILSSFEEDAQSTNEQLGKKFDMSKNMVARYIRVNSLIQPFLELLDNDDISLSTAAILSFLKMEEQEVVSNYVKQNDFKILIKHGEQLKALSKSGKFKPEKIEEIFQGKKVLKPQKPKKTIQLKRKNIENYFGIEETEEEIENTIIEALSFYFEHKNDTGKGGDKYVPDEIDNLMIE